jgi:hypothetical protein
MATIPLGLTRHSVAAAPERCDATSLRFRIWVCFLTLLISGCWLFIHLGHYALWDDEATTALPAQNVWRTGDSSAIVGDNVLAFRNGMMLKGLKVRYIPPLQYYVAAPFIGLFGQTALMARIGFALTGWATVAFMLFWLWRDRAPAVTWLLIAFALVGNISFYLYCRQCRYYALEIFLSVVLVYLYLHWNNKPRTLALFILCSSCLIACHYIAFGGLYLVLSIDYLFWGRRRLVLRRKELVLIALSQAIVAAVFLSIWTPIPHDYTMPSDPNWLLGRLTLYWWFWRDLGLSEFGPLLLIALSPLIYIFFRRDPRLLRFLVAAVLYLLVVAVSSPQAVSATKMADIRYACALIPLLMVWGVACIRLISGNRLWIAVPLGLIAFETNVLCGGLLAHQTIHSSPLRYAEELYAPPIDPYTVTADWIKSNIRAGDSVWVLPDYATYPLMYIAPRQIYAWQFRYPPRPPYRSLPEIHFLGRIAPDYLIAFGPYRQEVESVANAMAKRGTPYEMLGVLDVFWHDVYRPELQTHSFTGVTNFRDEDQAIYVYRRAASRSTAK